MNCHQCKQSFVSDTNNTVVLHYFDKTCHFCSSECHKKYMQAHFPSYTWYLTRRSSLHVTPDTQSNVNVHFTGQGRDIAQLKQVHAHVNADFEKSLPLSLLFVGCSTGEEIRDFQKFSHLFFFDCQYFGLDCSEDVIEQAKKAKYVHQPNFFTANVLEQNFQGIVRDKSGASLFDVVICRNLLIYYQDEIAKCVVETLSQITKKFLVLGMSDPFMFIVKDNEVQIGESFFEVVDFENRIFRKKI